ncbi:hypothetical protein JCM5353_000276 [Sporobolomyces roseus]
MSETATRPPEASAQQPSLKALGKRPLTPSNSESSPQPQSLVQQVKQQEKRVTRSSLGGSNGTRDKLDENGSNESGSSSPLYLPVDTAILLTTRLLPRLTHYPPTTSLPSSSSSVPAPAPAVPLPPDPITTTSTTGGRGTNEKKPLFRLMDETEFLPSRGSRHQPVASVDTSDALYHRLHRYPEVLEKRASRLERERLIHERSKLINELEDLRGRGWVYTGNSSAMGGRAEVERQRKLKEGEERLARYDALLPNQPRKSNFLNLSSNPLPSTSSLPTSTSLPNLHTSGRANSASPAPSALSHSASSHNLNTRAQQRSNRPSSLSRPVPLRPSASSSLLDPNAANRRGREISRPPTPVSATSTGGNGSMKITIRFDTSTSKQAGTGGGARRGREGERKLPERSGRGGRKSYAEDDDEESEEEEEDVEMGDEEGEEEESSLSDLDEDESDQKEEEEESFNTSTTSIPRATSSTSIAQKPPRSQTQPQPRPSAPPIPVQTRPSKPPRIRLKNSFFQTPSLRDQLFPKAAILSQFKTSTSNLTPSAESGLKQKKENRRRSSSRVAYAFGHRLPDAALMKQAEFEPHGGGSQGSKGKKGTPLEEMVLERMVKRGEGDEVVVLGGRLLPKSAVDAWRIDPVRVKRQRELSGKSQEEEAEVVVVKKEEERLVPSTAAPRSASNPRPRSIPPPPPVPVQVQTKPPTRPQPKPQPKPLSRPSPAPIPAPVPIPVPSQPKPLSRPIPKPVSSSSSASTGGGSSLGFAQPSKTQVLFASVPSVKRQTSNGNGDDMDIDR